MRTPTPSRTPDRYSPDRYPLYLDMNATIGLRPKPSHRLYYRSLFVRVPDHQLIDPLTITPLRVSIIGRLSRTTVQCSDGIKASTTREVKTHKEIILILWSSTGYGVSQKCPKLL